MVNLNGKTILVTGGRGFIGTNFIKLVDGLYTDLTIVNIDKRGKGASADVNTIVDGDKSTIDVLYLKNKTKNGNTFHDIGDDLVEYFNQTNYSRDLAGYSFDYVFHFAAESHVDRSIDDPSQFIVNNVVSTAKLLEYIRKNHPNARFIHISTDEVYGHLGVEDDPFTEHSKLAPRSPYSSSKASSDLVVLSYYETYKMDVMVTRCCNNYGPSQDDEKFIPTILRSLLNGKKIPIYGTGENIREWIYVDDHNKSVLEIANFIGTDRVFNIHSGHELTNIELAKTLIGKIHPNDPLDTHIEYVKDRAGHDFRYALTSRTYERNFQLTRFEEGIDRTIEYYRTKYKG